MRSIAGTISIAVSSDTRKQTAALREFIFSDQAAFDFFVQALPYETQSRALTISRPDSLQSGMLSIERFGDSSSPASGFGGSTGDSLVTGLDSLMNSVFARGILPRQVVLLDGEPLSWQVAEFAAELGITRAKHLQKAKARAIVEELMAAPVTSGPDGPGVSAISRMISQKPVFFSNVEFSMSRHGSKETAGRGESRILKWVRRGSSFLYQEAGFLVDLRYCPEREKDDRYRLYVSGSPIVFAPGRAPEFKLLAGADGEKVQKLFEAVRDYKANCRR